MTERPEGDNALNALVLLHLYGPVEPEAAQSGRGALHGTEKSEKSGRGALHGTEKSEKSGRGALHGTEKSAQPKLDLPQGTEKSAQPKLDLPQGTVEWVREEGTDAVAESIANQIETAILDKVWDRWHAPGEADLARDAETLTELDNIIHKMVIGEPTEKLMSGGLGIPDSNPIASIVQQVPIDFADQTLGNVRLAIEIGGIIISVMSGNPVLACACLKAFMHDQVHRMLVSEIKDLITGGHSETSAIDKSSTTSARMERDPNSAIVSLHEAVVMRAPSNVAKPHTSSSTPVKAAVVPAPGYAIKPHTSRTAPAQAAATAAPPDAAKPPASTTSINVPTEAAATTTKPGSASSERAEGREVPDWADAERGHAGPGGGLGHAGPGGHPAPVGKVKELTFVRLRICYEMENLTVAGNDRAQPGRLMRLLVLRDSRRFVLPEALKTMDGTFRSADGAAEYIAGQLDKGATTKAWQLRRVADKDDFTLDVASVASLVRNLSKTLVGLSPDLDSAGLIVQEIPADYVEQFLGSGGRCIEVIGFTVESFRNRTLKCVGVMAPVRDEFCDIIASALTDSGLASGLAIPPVGAP